MVIPGVERFGRAVCFFLLVTMRSILSYMRPIPSTGGIIDFDTILRPSQNSIRPDQVLVAISYAI